MIKVPTKKLLKKYKGRIVKINKGKYKGYEGIILYRTPKTYHIEILNKTRPYQERFTFDNKGKP